ncbi:uncharacterized protein LOC129300910 [Prosopis cineraria]|uniref:uncharacterized protein LOC129300910 n=1 Tax=Prosopis cineraria TaxID=364024 RepID=UPI00240F8C54|nr:uncharacterized protein LOC129300910 [Prosopis cineraria]
MAEQLLQKAAKKWWDGICPIEDRFMTWDEFKEQFFKYYVPTALRAEKEEADAFPNLIRGNLKLNRHNFITLFDARATHSFVSHDYVEKFNLNVYDLPYSVRVSTSSGIVVVTSKSCLNCVVEFENRTSTMDLIYLPMKGIDLIVGMDWLSTNNAILDCKKTIMSLPVFIASMVTSGKPQLLSAAQVDMCIRKRCQAFAIFFYISMDIEEGLEFIDVVQEFPNVFPKDIISLPPKWEVEFFIDLALETEPISKAPYRMSPSELVELKKQIEELMEKGFIRLSVSP